MKLVSLIGGKGALLKFLIPACRQAGLISNKILMFKKVKFQCLPRGSVATLRGSNDESFTLIELMVSLGILTLVLLSAMGIYLRVIGTREQSLGDLNIQEEGQYIMGLIVKDVRAGQIDYSSYGGNLDEPEDELMLLDFSGDKIRYKSDLAGSGSCTADRCVLQRCKGNPCGDYENITMTDVSLERLDFYVNPVSNPFTAGSETYSHPYVTIILGLKSLTVSSTTAEIVLQQTVSQRYTYKK